MHNFKNKEKTVEHIFRAYDIRGIVDIDLTEDTIYNIGLAFGSTSQKQNQNTVCIARDGRISGIRLIECLKNGLIDSGCNVIDIGAVATPLLYFATKTLIVGTKAIGTGIMLTGSHNPKDYNGLKMMINDITLCGEDIIDLKNLILSENIQESKQGKYTEINMEQYYIETLIKTIKTKKLKIVIDAGNGIAGNIAPKLFRTLGCEVIELFCDVNGNFPNHHPDPSKPENLKDLIEKIIETKSDIGLAFDGDGDRLGLVTDKGEIIDADRQLILYARDVLKKHPKSKIIFDVKCTKNLAEDIIKHGGHPIMSQTGHALIKRKLAETKAKLAGEMSGHVFFNDKWYGFDDALYTGARFLEILSNANVSADKIFKNIPKSINTPEINILVKEEYKFKIVEDLVKTSTHTFPDAEIITIDGVRVEFKNGWALVRASNTTANLVMRFEADTENDLLQIKNLFTTWVLNSIQKHS